MYYIIVAMHILSIVLFFISGIIYGKELCRLTHSTRAKNGWYQAGLKEKEITWWMKIKLLFRLQAE